ncbi:hypothetical protein ABT263_25225 [Kitasatospora sp. NPDC001603]|uniref:hypothetical protein n=1 Tax=Kitasatospora sp. NPDC001603 TaxID=3154388 RepID=UPI0033199745
MFRPRADRPETSFRLQLFTAHGHRPVAVATATLYEGASLTNACEDYVEAVWERLCPDEALPPLWVQRQLYDDETRWGTAEFELVTFERAEPYRVGAPRWRTITPSQLAELVGTPVAEDRGEGYVPRELPPVPELRFRVMNVADLGIPHPFRVQCMTTGTPRPGRGGRSCCWYHRGDWQAANELAFTILAEATTAGVTVKGMAKFAHQRAVAAGVDDWQRSAVDSLLRMGVAIVPDGSGGFINGQHRTRAMLDAGVLRTIVLLEEEEK